MAAVQGISTVFNRGYSTYLDNQTQVAVPNGLPVRLAILGTCPFGKTNEPNKFNNANIAQLPLIFGRQGDMLEQAQEAQAKDMSNILALRYGARPFFLAHVGGTTSGEELDGLWIQPTQGGKELGTRLGIAYDKTDSRLVITDLVTSSVLFDNGVVPYIDSGEFIIRGTAVAGSGTSIGTATSRACVPFSSAAALDGQIDFYAGDDGTQGLSRMEVYGHMLNGLKILENTPYRTFCAPERATLNAPVSTTNTATGGTAFPVKDSIHDKLGHVYLEEIDGVIETYWDVNGDGTAEFWSPVDTNSYGTVTKGGVALGTDSFKEPNFAYTIAYEMLLMNTEVRYTDAVVAVEAKQPGRPLSEWHGSAPTFEVDLEGDIAVTTNGSGLLGNKYLMGSTSFRNATAYGGFIATTDPYFDTGTELEDSAGNPIDMGKYLTIWAGQEIFLGKGGVRSNLPYLKISPIAYAAFRERLPLGSAPTNKDYPTLGLGTNTIPRAILQDMITARITIARKTDSGNKILDGAVASLPTSDYNRQSTMRVIELVDRSLRAVTDPRIGEPLPPEEEIAFQQDLNEVLSRLADLKLINAGSAELVFTPLGRRRGEGIVNVVLSIPLELRKITFSIAMSPNQ